MKTLNVVFEDAEYEALVQKKGTLNWHDFILMLKNGKEAKKA